LVRIPPHSPAQVARHPPLLTITFESAVEGQGLFLYYDGFQAFQRFQMRTTADVPPADQSDPVF
jgi:hypothetical protein